MSYSISNTSFTKFAASQHTAKVRTAVEIKKNLGTPYSPATDYWGQGRRAIERCAKDRTNPRDLVDEAKKVHAKKQANYTKVYEGFADWNDLATPIWTPPKPKPFHFVSGGIEVKVNPELSCEIDGETFVIKMFLTKKDGLTIRRIEAMLALLEMGYGEDETSVGVLDVRSAHLHLSPIGIGTTMALLHGEAASLGAMLDFV